MKFASIIHSGEKKIILKTPEGRIALLKDLFQYLKVNYEENIIKLIEVIHHKPEILLQLENSIQYVKQIENLTQLDWLPPVHNPSKILGVAFNNIELMRKAHRDPGVPNFFLKPPSALQGHLKPIIVDPEWGAVIPEPEICAVIGKKAKHISENQALDYVFGFLIHNDVTSHGLKFQKDSIAVTYDKDMARPEFYNWRNLNGPNDTDAFYVYHTRSKGTDTFGPMGPWLTTLDEVGDPNNLSVTGTINNVFFTKDHTSNYRFSVEECIAEASRYFTLETGDLISFGTTGKGTKKFPRGHKSLLIGEHTGIIEINIEKLGSLANPIKHQTGGA